MVRLTDRPDMTLDVYRGRKTTTQQQQQSMDPKVFEPLAFCCISFYIFESVYETRITSHAIRQFLMIMFPTFQGFDNCMKFQTNINLRNCCFRTATNRCPIHSAVRRGISPPKYLKYVNQCMHVICLLDNNRKFVDSACKTDQELSIWDYFGKKPLPPPTPSTTLTKHRHPTTTTRTHVLQLNAAIIMCDFIACLTEVVGPLDITCLPGHAHTLLLLKANGNTS